MKVWAGYSSFHSRRECHQLTKCKYKPALLSLDDERTMKLKPCKSCFPDAPREMDLRRPYCWVCGYSRPCPHNGGVLIRETRTFKTGYGSMKAGETIEAYRWVWPDSPILLAERRRAVVE